MSGEISAVLVAASTSPNARLESVPVGAVTLTDGLWAPRLRTNRDITLPTQYPLLEGTERIDNRLPVFVARKPGPTVER
jgi:hypothetical protein